MKVLVYVIVCWLKIKLCVLLIEISIRFFLNWKDWFLMKFIWMVFLLVCCLMCRCKLFVLCRGWKMWRLCVWVMLLSMIFLIFVIWNWCWRVSLFRGCFLLVRLMVLLVMKKLLCKVYWLVLMLFVCLLTKKVGFWCVFRCILVYWLMICVF